jgi:Family of unknown function (DUF5677)
MSNKYPRQPRRHPGTNRIVRCIVSLERHLNGLKMIPATRRLRSAVILALLSKSLTVGRAVCVLVDAGYPAEAFGLARTLLEILFSVHYITNKYTEERAEQYVKYQARVRLEWLRITQKHFPEKAAKLPALDPFTLKIAKEFKSKHSWTGDRGHVQMMAIEEDSAEFDEQGRGYRNEFDYDGLYFWSSQYVHATVAGIDGHASKVGEVFRVRAGRQLEKHHAADALFIVAVSLCKAFVYACRSINETQPKAIRDLYKLIRTGFYGRPRRK